MRAFQNTSVLNRFILFILFLFSAATSNAQTQEWDELLQELMDEQVSDEDGEDAWAELLEELVDLHEHPLDINSTTIEELKRLPFLEPKEAEAIVDYRARYGAFHSLGELLLIPELERSQIRWLRQLLFVPTESQNDRSAQKEKDNGLRQELTTRVDVPLYERAGWPWAQGVANRIRYTLQSGRHWDIGLRAEKDSGEPMFTRDNPLWDSWGGHVMFKDLRIGSHLSCPVAILGDYKATFGEGLVMNTGFRLGKQQTNLWRTPSLLRPHRSTDECRFLRGAAATLVMGRQWSFSVLYSWRKQDATLQKDNTLRAINTTGLHRTEGELARRGSLDSHTTALHLAWQKGRGHIGFTALYQYYNHQFAQSSTLYRQIAPEGYQFGAVSTDYSFRSPHLVLSGETAYSLAERNKGWATLNKAVWRPNNDWKFSLIQRFYGKHYFSPHASAFGENSTVQNESGLCLLIDALRLGPIAVNAMFDYFYSPWPRYTMSRYSKGFETSLQTIWQVNRRQRAVVRYSLKSKERSDRRYFSHRFRAAFSQSWNQEWSSSFSGFFHLNNIPSIDELSRGFAIMPRVDYSPSSSPFQASLAAIWFSTDDYNSRLYIYEPSLAQSFGFQLLYGRGERLAAKLRYHFGRSNRASRRLQLQFKAGITHYRDRSTISSGPTLIDSSWKPDIQVLLRLQLNCPRRAYGRQLE